MMRFLLICTVFTHTDHTPFNVMKEIVLLSNKTFTFFPDYDRKLSLKVFSSMLDELSCWMPCKKAIIKVRPKCMCAVRFFPHEIISLLWIYSLVHCPLLILKLLIWIHQEVLTNATLCMRSSVQTSTLNTYTVACSSLRLENLSML